MAKQNRYSSIIESLFSKQYSAGIKEITFTRQDIEVVANELKIALPKNLGDILYSFRYRNDLPKKILDTEPKDYEWIIRSTGRSQYKFVLTKKILIQPSLHFAITKIPDSTPGIIARYAMNDEQALLAKIRYNRLLDIFTGLTCYSLQNHLRTTVPSMGQVETDEIYIGIDKRGAHYFIPVQAKGKNDKIGIVQIEQDFAIGESKFPSLICKPIAAQFLINGDISLFEFEIDKAHISITSEKHYRLVNTNELSQEELDIYKSRMI